MKRIHYGWIICAGCTLLLFCMVGLASSGFSVYQPYFIEACGLTNTEGSLVITVRSLAALISMLFVDKYIDRTGLRLGVTIAMIGCGGSFVLFGAARGFAGCCISAAVAGVSFGLGGLIPAAVLIDRWFQSRKAFAFGICVAGTGAATIVTPSLITYLIESVSPKFAFFSEAVFVAAAAVILFALIRNAPVENGLEPYGDAGTARPDIPKESEPPAKGGRFLLLLMLPASVMIGAISGPGFLHLSMLYKTSGFGSIGVSLLISVVGLSLTAGKCIYGWIADRIGGYRSGYLFFGLLVLGLALCCFAATGGYAAAVAALLFFGLGLSLATVGLSVFAGDMASYAEYEKTLKKYQVASMAGALFFGPAPGMIADRTGSYVPLYVLLTIFGVCAMALVLLSYRLKRAPAAFQKRRNPDGTRFSR